MTSQGITEHLLDLQQAEVPAEALRMMRLSLADWAACGIAGAREPDFADFVTRECARADGPASVLGGGTTAPATAALLNGTLSHALDYDDTHFAHIGHPSVAVIPAVLALAEAEGAELDAVIGAATVGVEASVRVGVWLGRDHYQVGFHQTATAGAFGAVLGCARLLGLSEAITRRALGLCASMASGLKSQFGTMAKPLNAGLAARTGVEAVLWAQAGVTAAQDGLAGPLGFGPTHHGLATPIAARGDVWEILSISHKFHSCCHGLHAMLEALGDFDGPASTVAYLRVETHPRWMTVCNIAEPQTGLEAKFSYRHTAAMTLLGHDTGGIASFSDALAVQDDLVALRSRVEVVANDSLAETEARVEITTQDGTVQRFAHDLMAPMTVDIRGAKLRRKAAALLSEERAEALFAAVEGRALAGLVDQLTGR